MWTAIAVIWGVSWGILWESAELGWDEWVHDPALVAISLGSIALIVFAAVYVREEKEKLKGAIAATFIIVFLLLTIDLLTIKGFRDALSDVSDVEVVATGTETSSTGASPEPCPSPSPAVQATEEEQDPSEVPAECVQAPAVAVSFVDGLFGVFKWGITAIIIFYFGVGTAADAVKTAVKEKKERAQIAADADHGGASTPWSESRSPGNPRTGFSRPEPAETNKPAGQRPYAREPLVGDATQVRLLIRRSTTYQFVL